MPPRRKPMRVAPLPRWMRRLQALWNRIPPSSHGIWALARLGVLGAVLYANASHFDITEHRTLLTMALLEAAGFKRKG